MTTHASQTADLLLYNGTVHTVVDGQPRAEAVALRGGRIIAVGSNERLRPLSGRHTELLDLQGRLVLPGFQDAHVHPVDGGMTRRQCDLHDLGTAEDYLAAIEDYSRAHPELPWILGGGWSMEAFERGLPTKGPLDMVVPGRPVYLPDRDGHSAWVSSRALELAGVTATTADPPDGRIERDAAGEPTGALHEGAQALVTALLPAATGAEVLAGLLEGQRYLHSLGITGWQDAIVGGDTVGQGTLAAYQDLAGRGGLTARVVGALWWDRQQGAEQIPELVAKRDASHVGRFRATSVKVMLDGVCETRTAAMLDPYLDEAGQPTTDRGISFIDPDRLGSYVTLLDAAGFQVHFHTIGDRAVRNALDAIEAARAVNGFNDHRPHLAHIQVVHPADLDRFAALGVVANAQPLWACNEPQMSELTIPFLGPVRASWQYPFGSLLRSGARLAGGSDWPVSTPDPLQEMHVAVNRTPPGLDAEPFLPHEAITLPQAVRAFTHGAAYVNHLDGVTGTIEPGKLADLVVLDRDIFEGPSSEIAAAKVVLTLVGGVLVHEAGR